jgi:SGNH hydrolase-like domain, acetyltransferase AlgX
MSSLEMSSLRKGRWLLRLKGSTPFTASFVLLGLGLYTGEQIIRVNPQLTPVKAQMRLQGNRLRSYAAPDLDVGFVTQPNLRARIANQDFEFFNETDSYGFHNRMPWPDKIDILFLGDSLLEGVGVGIDGQFSSLVGQKLKAKKILNLGMAGAAPNRQLRTYRKFGTSLRPGLVVSCIYLAADLDNELHFDAWLKGGSKGDFNQFRLRLGDELHPKSFWTRVQRKSYLCGKLTELALRWWAFPDRFDFPNGTGGVFLDIDHIRSLAQGLNPADRRLRLMLESLKGLQAFTESQGAELLVVLIPSKEEVYGGPSIPEVLKPVSVFEQRLKEEKFSVLSLYDAIRSRSQDRRPAYFTRDIHLNRYGNQIVSDCLVDWLRKNHLPGSGESLENVTKSRINAENASS